MWTSKLNLHNIDVAVNECYRTATGALRSTPIAALRVEAGYTSTLNLGNKRATNIISKTLTDINHPLYSVAQECLQRTKPNRKNSISSLSKILTFILSHGCFPSESPQYVRRPPPWKRHLLPIDTSLSELKKDNTSKQIYHMLYQALMDKHKPINTFYTDGSNKDNNSSYAIIELKQGEAARSYQGILPEGAGSYLAEVTALLKAMSLAQTCSSKTMILTDSLNVLNGIKNGINNSTTFERMRGILYNNNHITLAWIPGHVGIEGNEDADQAAKEALRYPLIKDFPNLPELVQRIFNCHQKEDLKSSWQNEQNFLRRHQFSPLRSPYNKHLNRQECISLFRIRVGKTLFSSRHYFTRESPEECSHCRQALSIWHIFVECPISRQTSNIDSTEEVQKQLAVILNPSDGQTFQRIKDATSLHQKFKEI